MCGRHRIDRVNSLAYTSGYGLGSARRRAASPCKGLGFEECGERDFRSEEPANLGSFLANLPAFRSQNRITKGKKRHKGSRRCLT